MRYLLASALLLLPVTACRDAIVDPLPADVPPAVEEGEPASFYLKGPDTLRYGQTAEFRIAPSPESVRAGWTFRETAALSGETQLLEIDSPTTRITDMTARAYGSVLLVGTHYDADGRVLGEGRKRVHVVAR